MADTTSNAKERLKKAAVPGAASIVGAGVGLLLTRTNGLRRAMPDLKDLGVGDLAGDLRERLDGVLGKSGSSNRHGGDFDADELAARRRERGERRTERRKRSGG